MDVRKKIYLLSICLTSLLAACLIVSSAPAAEPLPIAVLNVDRIFNPLSYKPLADRLAPLKAEVVELDKTISTRQVELETVQSQLRTVQPNSPQFEKLKLQFTKLQTELQLFVDRERQGVQRKEGAIYLALHREIDAVLQPYCKAKGIRLVIRQQQYPTTGELSSQDILKTLSRNVLYEDGLDITDDILKALAAQAAK